MQKQPEPYRFHHSAFWLLSNYSEGIAKAHSFIVKIANDPLLMQKFLKLFS